MRGSLKKWLTALERSNPELKSEAVRAGLMGQRDRLDATLRKHFQHLERYSQNFMKAADGFEDQGLYQAVAEYLGITGKWLDFGIGHGHILNHANPQDTCVAAEILPHMIKSAQNRLQGSYPVNTYASATLKADSTFGFYLVPNDKEHGNIIVPGQVNIVMDDFRNLPGTNGPLSVLRTQDFTPDDVTLLLSGEALHDVKSRKIATYLIDQTLQGAIWSAYAMLDRGSHFHIISRMRPIPNPLEPDLDMVSKVSPLFKIENIAHIGRFTDLTSNEYGVADVTGRTQQTTFDLVAYTMFRR